MRTNGELAVHSRSVDLVGRTQNNNGPQLDFVYEHLHDSEHPGPASVTPRPWALFKSAQWSADGTTVITSNNNNTINTFILPPDLLEGPDPHILQQYASHRMPSSVYATAITPSYSLSDPLSTLFLASLASLPIRLLSPFTPNIVASYPLVNQMTETYIAPHSLLFDSHSSNCNIFFAGSESLISVFDISRDGAGPVQEMKTIPSRRKKIVGGGVGIKGIVSSLAMNSEGMLAAGTFTRWIGLYDGGGRGGTVGLFELGKDEGDEAEVAEGAGITQVLWSQCGRYLCVAERASNGLGVWDIRGTGKRLCWLKGRNAQTMQRMAVDIAGQDLWAGGKDGMVRLWQGVGTREGVVEPDWEFPAHEDAVSSTVMHPCGTVLATSSGQRHYHARNTSNRRTNNAEREGSAASGDESELENSGPESSSSSSTDAGQDDNSLRIWAL